MQPFLIRMLGALLNITSKFSLFDFLLCLLPKRFREDTTGTTELWVLLNGVLSFGLLGILSSESTKMLKWLVALYGAYRVFEVVTYQFYTQIYGGYRERKEPSLKYTVASYRRSIVLAGLLYIEVLAWFAVMYRLGQSRFKTGSLSLDSPLVALYYSVITMMTIGYGDISPQANLGFILVSTQALVGWFMTILVLARVISYIPRPETEDPAEK